MEAKDIKVGKTYEIKVGKNNVAIRITKAIDEGGWEAVSLATDKPLVIKSAERIIAPYTPEKKAAAPKKQKSKQSPAETAKEVLDNTVKPLKPMSALDAAVKVLAESNEPLNCKQMVDVMIAENYWTPGHGKTPANTLHAAISKEIKVKADQSRFKKAGRGQFTLSTAK